MRDVHLLEHRLDLGAALVGSHFGVHQRQLDVLIHGELVDQVEALEHETDMRLANRGAFALRIGGNILAEQPVAPGRRAVDQPEDVQQGGLAAAGWAHDRDELALAQAEVDVIDCRRLDDIGAIDLLETCRFDDHVRFPLAFRGVVNFSWSTAL